MKPGSNNVEKDCWTVAPSPYYRLDALTDAGAGPACPWRIDQAVE
jgi:hypothetical protein